MIIVDPLIRITIIALDIYLYLVIAWVIMSWLVNFRVINMTNQFVRLVWEFLWRITDPVLKHFRRFLPTFGGIDVSPILLFLAILLVQMVLQNILIKLHGM